ncbi:MAG: pitrilysin family protein [Desulfobacterales bacterium]|nr:pitrilysin family protein [Desulfobacterales bacterium]MDJ0874414.1 pitrilysin family protein [Desulfobacterales bacterium]MDJ0882686.1 pitrilysin family protein [Desulfobacterales bacterium]
MDHAVSKTVLSNGIIILTKQMPHVHSVSMGVWVNVGARDEALDENGLSHLIEHMIFKGTRKRSAYQIAKEFDAIGGQTNAFTAMENTCYHARVLETHLDTMVDILTDIFLNSVFDAREVERERPVILQEIGMVEDSPEEFIHLLSGRNFWGDNPLGRSILGSPENIVRFDAKAVRGFFQRCYQPERIVVAAAGSVDHQSLVDLISPAFESIEPGNGFPERVTPETQPLVDVCHRQLEQAHICLSSPGIATTDPRRYAFSLMNTIFGGNMSSRLFQEIREKRGLAYSVYSYISSFEDTGMFGAYAGVEPAKAQEVAALMIAGLRRFENETVRPSELRDAKEYTKGSMLLAAENTDNQMVRLAQGEINFGRHIPLADVVERIETVQAEDIQALAADLFRNDPFVLTVLGPLSDKKGFASLIC